jgi:hypothetical protein
MLFLFLGVFQKCFFYKKNIKLIFFSVFYYFNVMMLKIKLKNILMYFLNEKHLKNTLQHNEKYII